MALIIYGNGLFEEIKPKKDTFTDKEILNIFKDNDRVRSKRILEITNTWCVWGENTYNDKSQINTLASAFLEEEVFTKVMFIHDTELNPKWKLSDTPIYKSYETFKKEVSQHIDFVAENIIKANEEYNRSVENESDNPLMILDTIKPTQDKRILFELDIERQDKRFFDDYYFNGFAEKVFEYRKNNAKRTDNEFIAYADSRFIVMIRKEQVPDFIDKLIKHFTGREEYEKCAFLKDVSKIWQKKLNVDSSTNSDLTDKE